MSFMSPNHWNRKEWTCDMCLWHVVRCPNAMDFDWQNLSGRFVNYYTYGAAVVQAEVDCLTGNFTVSSGCTFSLDNPVLYVFLAQLVELIVQPVNSSLYLSLPLCLCVWLCVYMGSLGHNHFCNPACGSWHFSPEFPPDISAKLILPTPANPHPNIPPGHSPQTVSPSSPLQMPAQQLIFLIPLMRILITH